MDRRIHAWTPKTSSVARRGTVRGSDGGSGGESGGGGEGGKVGGGVGVWDRTTSATLERVAEMPSS